MDEEWLSNVVAGLLSPTDVGLSVAVVHGTKRSTAAAGPVNPNSVFEVGSIGKSLTAALAIRVIERAGGSVDDSICNHLSLAPLAWRDVSIRDLLDHRSGLPDYEFATTDRDAVLEIRHQSLGSRRFTYRNSNYCVVGAMIAEVSGRPFVEVMRSDLIDPNGLHGVQINDPRVVTVRGHVGPGEPSFPYEDPREASMADGPVAATALGMASWAARFWSAEFGTPPAIDPKRLYSQGWRFGRKHEPPVFHAGGVDGFESFMAVWPGRRAIVALTNCDLSDPRRVALEIDRRLGQERTPV